MDQAAGLILQLKKGNKQNSSRLTVCEIHLFSSRERTDEIWDHKSAENRSLISQEKWSWVVM